MSNNWNYRQQLIKNADNIIQLNQSSLCIEQQTFDNRPGNTHTPFLYSSCVDKSTPVGYENSDMKQSFLIEYQKKCTMIAPEIHLK